MNSLSPIRFVGFVVAAAMPILLAPLTSQAQTMSAQANALKPGSSNSVMIRQVFPTPGMTTVPIPVPGAPSLATETGMPVLLHAPGPVIAASPILPAQPNRSFSGAYAGQTFPPAQQPIERGYIPDPSPSVAPMPQGNRDDLQPQYLNHSDFPAAALQGAPTAIMTGTVIPNRFIPNPAPIYAPPSTGPAYTGVYYFSNYSYYGAQACSYPSAYGSYGGLPGFIFATEPGLIMISQPPTSEYVGGYISMTDFSNHQIQSLYDYYNLATAGNPTIYHGPEVLPVANEESAAPSEQAPSGESNTQAAPRQTSSEAPAYAPGSYKEAFADIEAGWESGDIEPIHKHIRSGDLKIAISLNGKYAYSISAGNWEAMTRDALDRLQTVSFEFTLLRFQKNGDLTGYATHATAGSEGSGAEQTMYVSYTLRHRNGLWYIVASDISTHPLIEQQPTK